MDDVLLEQAEESDETEQIAELVEPLIEDVSIDGMCGVY
jgi:mycofactocin precursor